MISIAMATYNGEKYLLEQINSILEQTYSDYELIICDDGSKDKTRELLNEIAKNNSRVKIYFNEQNLGFKKNFEKALSLCTGDYIAFCDQDDIWTKDHLEVLLETIKEHDLACGNALLVDTNGNSLNLTMYDCLSNFTLPADIESLFKNLLYANFAQGTAMMISKSIKEKIIPIPDCVNYHDWWAASIASLEKGCAFTEKIILHYRQHGNNVTTTKKWKFFDSINDTIKQRKLLHFEYENKIAYAKLFLDKNISENNKKSIDECVQYYQFLLDNKRNKAFPLFKKNYNSIYWIRKPTKSNYLIRILKIFILHI